ncbi:MAG: hypothetical protein L6407_05385, partial [Candidatus Delongbacteria bacterium]|nr:hypothetical protein [Candidatus Delongbacteria bacterium]
MRNRKFRIVIFTVMSLLLQSCLMTIIHPVRRVNSSTFIDDNQYEISTAGEVTHAFEIDELGSYGSTLSTLGDFEFGYKIDKNMKILADYSLIGGNGSNNNGHLFMSGFEKSFPFKDNVYYAMTAQAQYSFVEDTDESDSGTGRVTIESNLKSVNLINEIVYQPNLTFVVRFGLYYDHIWNESKISGITSYRIKFEDDVIGLPFKASARYKNFEVFGGFMHFKSLNTDDYEEDSNSY